jgi:hypothetical protein
MPWCLARYCPRTTRLPNPRRGDTGGIRGERPSIAGEGRCYSSTRQPAGANAEEAPSASVVTSQHARVGPDRAQAVLISERGRRCFYRLSTGEWLTDLRGIRRGMSLRKTPETTCISGTTEFPGAAAPCRSRSNLLSLPSVGPTFTARASSAMISVHRGRQRRREALAHGQRQSASFGDHRE